MDEPASAAAAAVGEKLDHRGCVRTFTVGRSIGPRSSASRCSRTSSLRNRRAWGPEIDLRSTIRYRSASVRARRADRRAGRHRAVVSSEVSRAAARVRLVPGDRTAALEQRRGERIVGYAERKRLQTCANSSLDKRRLAHEEGHRRRQQPFGGVRRERVLGSVLEKLRRARYVHRERLIVGSAFGYDRRDLSASETYGSQPMVARVVRQDDGPAGEEDASDLGDLVEAFRASTRPESCAGSDEL